MFLGFTCFLSLFFFCFPYLLPIFQFDSPFLICRNSIHSLGTKTSLVFCSENIFSQFLSFSLFIGHFYEEKILKFSIFFTFLKLSKIITTQWLKTMPISHVTVLRSEVQAGWLGSLLQASQVKSKVFFSLGGLPSGDSGRESTSKMIWLVTEFSVPCDCRTEVPISLLAGNQESSPSGFLEATCIPQHSISKRLRVHQILTQPLCLPLLPLAEKTAFNGLRGQIKPVQILLFGI